MDYKKLSRITDSSNDTPYYGDMGLTHDWKFDPTVSGRTALPEFKRTLALFKRLCKSNGGRAYSWNKGLGWTALFVSKEDALNAKQALNSRGLTVLGVYKQPKAFNNYTEKLDARPGDKEYEDYLKWDALNNITSAPFVLVLSNSTLGGDEASRKHWSSYEEVKDSAEAQDSTDFSDIDALLEGVDIVEGAEFDVDLNGRSADEVESYIREKIEEDYYEEDGDPDYDESRGFGPEVECTPEDNVLHVSVWENV